MIYVWYVIYIYIWSTTTLFCYSQPRILVNWVFLFSLPFSFHAISLTLTTKCKTLLPRSIKTRLSSLVPQCGMRRSLDQDLTRHFICLHLDQKPVTSIIQKTKTAGRVYKCRLNVPCKGRWTLTLETNEVRARQGVTVVTRLEQPNKFKFLRPD